MNDEYLPGQIVTLTATFRNLAGDLVDPTSVTCKVKTPAGTITSYTPTKSSTGVYTYDLAIPSGGNGQWEYRFEGSGAVVASGETAFFVRDSSFD